MKYSTPNNQHIRGTKIKARATGYGTQMCTVRTTGVLGMPALSGGVAFQGVTIDPLNLNHTPQSVANIAGSYEFFRIKSLVATYIPVNGFTQPGFLRWAFLDNPELMPAYLAGSTTVKTQIIDSAQNMSLVPLSDRSTKVWNASRIRSRNWYSINAGLSGVNDYDRSVPSFFACKAESSVLTGGYGLIRFEIVYEFSGLGAVAANTLMSDTLSGGDQAVFSFPLQNGIPAGVTLRTRELEQRYVLEKPPDDKPTPPVQES